MALPKYSGGLANYLNSSTKSVLGSSAGTKVENIDFHDLIPHERNFYGMRDIPSLAKDMSISNWIEPLRVQRSVDEPGKYIILSGERRYRAVMYRYERGEINTREIPCIIADTPESDDLLSADMKRDVAIIMANSHRVKNYSERLQEIEVLEPVARIYYQKAKEEEEHPGPGFFRDYFAEQFLNISPAALYRLKSLKNLLPAFLSMLDAGNLTKQIASELAKHPQEEQQELFDRLSVITSDADTEADVSLSVSDVRKFFGAGNFEPAGEPAGEPAQVSTQDVEPADEPAQMPTHEPEPAGEPEQVPTQDIEPADELAQVPTQDVEPAGEPAQVPIQDVEPAEEPAQMPTHAPEPMQEPVHGVQTPISQPGIDFVLGYLQNGLKDSQENLAAAYELKDDELMAQFEMEVASLRYAIVKLKGIKGSELL